MNRLQMRMSADRSSLRLPVVVVCGLLNAGSVVAADEVEMPDMDFLEYLGSWDESDEDWIVLRDTGEIRKNMQEDEQDDSTPEGEESRETANEH